MNFEVTNGAGTISIEQFGLGDYFRFDIPVSVVWDDYDGSSYQYLAIGPYHNEYREEIARRITLNLDEDYTDRLPELKILLEPLFELFTNGKYSVTYEANADGNSLVKHEVAAYRHTQESLSDGVLIFPQCTGKAARDERLHPNSYIYMLIQATVCLI